MFFFLPTGQSGERSRRPVITITLAALCVAVFIATSMSDGPQLSGADETDLVEWVDEHPWVLPGYDGEKPDSAQVRDDTRVLRQRIDGYADLERRLSLVPERGFAQVGWLTNLFVHFDLDAVAAIAKKHQVISVCDNTFMTPYFQRPLEHGFDLVTHSTTKYLNGHSDVIGGFVATSSDELAQRVRFIQNAVGGIPGPMDAFLVLRGVKTLHLRMQRHAENAEKIAAFLDAHPKVNKVMWPGLASHPQHALAKRQMKGFGGMMTFEMKGGLDEARRFLKAVKIFACAESLGGVESLIEHPAIMTHASVPRENREKVGITDGLIRLSVGVEDATDLIDDLKAAFDAA